MSGVVIKIYSGVHLGASIALKEGTWVFGRDDSADIIFADEGVAPRHAAITFSPGGIVRAEEELLLGNGGDGLVIDRNGVGHIDLGALARDEILLRAALARHLMDEGDGLCLGGEEIVIVDPGGKLQKLLRAANGQLRVAKHDERADIKIVRHLADGKVAVKTRDVHRISRHKEEAPFAFSHLNFCRRCGKQNSV